MVQQAQNLWNLVIEQRKPACLPRFCCNWFLHTHDVDNDINPYIYLSVWKVMRKGEIGFANVARRCQSSYTEFHSRSVSISITICFTILLAENQSYPGASTQTRLINQVVIFLFSFLSCIINYWLVLTLWSYLCLAFLFFHYMDRAGSKQEKDG